MNHIEMCEENQNRDIVAAGDADIQKEADICKEEKKERPVLMNCPKCGVLIEMKMLQYHREHKCRY